MSTTIITSRPIIMHASLAYLSPEVRALDSVILSRSACLPTELLSLIRLHLLHLATTHLLENSTHALAQYENSLRDLLCPDCVIYNQDIYGPDIWQWEQFTGACACARMPSASIFGRPRTSHARELTPFKPNPELFRDRIHWLETHLSSESQRILGSHASSDNPSKAIWRVVGEVLSGQDCRVLRGTSDHSIHSKFLGTSTFARRRNLVTIVSTASELNKSEGSSKRGLEGHWNSMAILYRAKQNLGLELEYDYEEGLENPMIISHSHPYPRLLCELSFDSPTLYGLILYAQSTIANTNPFQALATLIAACLSLPLTFATLTLTVLCFFSRPQSFRML